jgi:hypothetical protein
MSTYDNFVKGGHPTLGQRDIALREALLKGAKLQATSLFTPALEF